MEKPTKRFVLALALLLMVFLLQGLYLLHFQSLCEDEAIHQAAGLLYLRTDNFEGGFDNPPLLQLLFGPSGGLLSLFLAVTSPSLIAHSTITTLDTGLALLLGAFIIWFCLSLLFLFEGIFSPKISATDGLFIKTAKYFCPSAIIEALENKFAQATTATQQVFLGKLSPLDITVYLGVLLFKALPGTLLLLIPFLYLTLRNYERLWPSWFYTLIPALVYWVFFNFNKTYYGIRHLLPVLAFIYIAMGLVGQRFKECRALTFLVMTAIGINVVACSSSFPYHMSYFNFLGRGLSRGNFVIGTSDTDYGQEDRAMEATIAELPNDLPLLICPAPSMNPRLGYIAVCGEAVNRECGYPWLKYFRPLKRIGGSWLLYRLPESDFKSLAQSGSWEHVHLYLSVLLNEGMYERARQVSHRTLAKDHRAWPYLIQSLIFSQRVKECLALPVPPQYSRWQAIAAEIVGMGRGPIVEQRARAMLSLMELAPHKSFPYRQKFFSSPEGYTKLKSSMDRTVMRFLGSQLFDEKILALALPYMLATMPNNSKTVACERFVKVQKTKKMDDSVLKIVHSGPFAYHGASELMAQLKRFHEQNPDSYWAVVGQHYMHVNQRRGLISADLGFNTIFDRVDCWGHYVRSN